MIVIVHRANGFGHPGNSIEAICACLDAGFVPEIDIWGGKYLSHDRPRGDEPLLADLLKRAKLTRVLLHLKETSSFRAVSLFPGKPDVLDLVEADGRKDVVSDAAGLVATDNREWLTMRDVTSCHARGGVVLAAGHNIFRRNRRRWAELHAMGVDGILTDEPQALADYLGALPR